MKRELEKLLANLFFFGGLVTIVYACFRIYFPFGLMILGCLLIWLGFRYPYFREKKIKIRRKKIKTGEKKIKTGEKKIKTGEKKIKKKGP